MSDSSNSSQLLAALRQKLGGAVETQYLPVAASTNSTLKARLQQGGLTRPTLLITDEQPQGRGTRGRAWRMQPGLDVALTLAAPMLRAELCDPRLSLALGAAVALALESATGLQLGVKWPNDILAGPPGAQRKCGGMLLETCPAPWDGARWLLAGVGLNVNSTNAMFEPQLAVRLTTLRDALGAAAGRAAVTCAVACALAQALLGAGVDGAAAPTLAELYNAWSARDCTAGVRYSLARGGRTYAVTATGVERGTGYLRCTGDDGAEYIVTSYTELENP
jgi:BirA family transcriptional regulator, biotin operon repressor / biotin---[acetyl-CoA-carboxylase] ligase